MELSPDAARIVAFIRSIGIAVVIAPGGEPGFLPGIAIRDGGLACDPAALRWPGDLLHEAGHVAVTPPDRRPTLAEVPDDPAEEMAAIAWSYAAATAIGIDPAIVFHAAGYGGRGVPGDGDWLVAAFADGTGPGVPLLDWYGMTRAADYPAMTRWLR